MSCYRDSASTALHGRGFDRFKCFWPYLLSHDVLSAETYMHSMMVETIYQQSLRTLATTSHFFPRLYPHHWTLVLRTLILYPQTKERCSRYVLTLAVINWLFRCLWCYLVGYPVTCEDEDAQGCNYYFTYGKKRDENATTVFVVSKKGM